MAKSKRGRWCGGKIGRKHEIKLMSEQYGAPALKLFQGVYRCTRCKKKFGVPLAGGTVVATRRKGPQKEIIERRIFKQ